MPTYAWLDRFRREYEKLSPAQRRAFQRAITAFVADLRAGRGFRLSLRVKRVQGWPGVWELTWAPDGRATFEYGPEQKPGEPHVVWRRIGTHSVFREP